MNASLNAFSSSLGKRSNSSNPAMAGSDSGLSAWAFWPVWVMAMLATLIRGGNRGVALVVLEWLALLAAGALAMQWASHGQQIRQLTRRPTQHTSHWPWAVLFTAPLWVVVVQLFPWWPGLGGQPISAMPQATWFAALAGVPMAVSLALGRYSSEQQVKALVTLWVLVAVLQALVGLLQAGGLDGLRFDGQSGEPAIGTFASKNTYANLLVMAVPLALWRVLNAWGQRGKSDRSGGGKASAALWAWSGALLVLVTTILVTTSRGGISTGTLVLLLGVALLPKGIGSISNSSGRGSSGKRPSGSRWLRTALVVFALLATVALVTGGLDWTARFEADRLVSDAETRATMREGTWQGALAHLPFGVGLGAYVGVMPAFQAPEFGAFLADLAHSDYLQLFMDIGLLVLPLVLALGWLLLRQLAAFAVTQPGHGQAGAMRRLQVAAGLGALAMALHAWVDYPFHIPANMMLGSFLMGVFLRPLGTIATK